MDLSEISEIEKNEAKKNGFVLTGKTGAGKSTLLNVIFGKEIGNVQRTLKSVTQDPSIHYYKLENGEYISIIDTPGLSDTNNSDDRDIDKKHLENILKKIKEENIQIKGILFLLNYQNERFDSGEQQALINYNKLFPFESFWENIIIIFTHYYLPSDSDENLEEIKNIKEQTFSELLNNVMDTCKNDSNVVDFNDINIKYFSLYFPVKNDTQKENNNKVKNEIDSLFNKFYNKSPLFSKIEIIQENNYKFTSDDGKKYIGNVEILKFLDINNDIIKKKMKIFSKKENKEEEQYYNILNELKKNKNDIRRGDWTEFDWSNGICKERESPKIYCIETELKTDGSFLQRSVLKYEKNFDDIIVGWRIDSKWRDGTNGEWESENNPLLKHNVNFTFTSQRFRGERFGVLIYLMKFPE